MRILLIEDEKRIARFIKRGLEEKHYTVDTAYEGSEGAFLAETNPYDLIILDIILPDQNGICICELLRIKGIETPILLLSAKNSVPDIVRGLDAGADDYLTKPFAFEELLARVRALMRKSSAAKNNILKTGDLELHQIDHKVFRAGKEINLSNKEYGLLEYLMLNPGKLLTRTQISEHVWNENFDTLTNIFDVYIYRLRNKIDKKGEKPLIQSVRGVGYFIEAEP